MQSRAPLVIGGVLVGTLALGVAAVALLPVFFHDRIVEAVDTAADRQIRGDVVIGDLSLSLLRSFPRLDVQLTDVAILGEAPFRGIPLLQADELHLGLDLRSVIRGETLEIRSLHLTRPRMRVVVMGDGQTNTDLFLEEEASEAGQWTIELDEVVITDLELLYEDHQDDMTVQISDLDSRARGDLSPTVSRFDTETTIGALTAHSGGIPWLRSARVDADAVLDYDATTGGWRFGENELTINALRLGFQGTAVPAGEDWDLALSFETRDTSFATLLSLLPEAYGEQFEGVETSGIAGLSGQIDGRYASEGDHLPAFDLNVIARDGRFKYPDLPVAVERIDLDLGVRHPEGPLDLAKFDLKRLAFSAGGARLEGSMSVAHPVTDPLVDARFLGQVDLDALGQALPALQGSALPSGRLDLDVAFAGRASDLSAPHPGAVQANGTVRGRGLTYNGLAVPITVDTLALELSPERAEIRELRTRYGDSDLLARGHFDNLIGYGLGEGTLLGALELSSRHLDLRPFQGQTEPASEPSEADALLAVPTDLALVVEADLGRVITEEFQLDGAVGDLVVRDGAIQLDGLRAELLGGEARLDGTYRAPTAREAAFDLQIEVDRIDLVETISMFETLSRLAPLLEGARGRLDAELSLSTKLLPDGSPELPTLHSKGSLSPQGVVVRPKVLAQVAHQLGQPELSKLDLGGAEVSYVLESGRVELSPVRARLGDIPVRIRGSAGVLDRTLDLVLDLKLPTESLQKIEPLAHIKKALGRSADVSVRLRGDWDSPRVSIEVEGVQTAVEQAQELAGQAVDDLLAAARAQGDALLAEAEERAKELRAAARKAGDKLRQEADRQGERLIREARGNPLKEAAAREAARALRAEADRAAARGEAEAERTAQRLLAEARQKKQELLTRAERQMKSAVQ